MRNWSVDVSRIRKDKKKYNLWRLENLINFGLGKEKISEKNLKDNLKFLNIDPQKSKFLKFILSIK